MNYLRDEVRAGLVVFVSLFLMSIFVILIGGSAVFEKYDKYYAEVSNSGSLEQGAQVRLGGVRAGRVLNISIPEGEKGHVLIEFGVKKGTPIYKGTKAVIATFGFVGDTYLLLDISKATDEILTSSTSMTKTILPAKDPFEFKDFADKFDALSATADALMRDATKLFDSKNLQEFGNLLSNTNKAIVSTSSDIREITSGLRSTMDKLETVLIEMDKVVKDNRGEFGLTIKKARINLEKAEGMIENMEKASASLNKTINLQSRNIDALLRSLTETAENLNDVLQGLKEKPWSVIYRERQEE
ncbi:MAG: MCE family protein [Nitrospirae bacterium]|nr:MCE family protein [Nitrospirota bacterium]